MISNWIDGIHIINGDNTMCETPRFATREKAKIVFNCECGEEIEMDVPFAKQCMKCGRKYSAMINLETGFEF
jgi:hypothetical protein